MQGFSVQLRIRSLSFYVDDLDDFEDDADGAAAGGDHDHDMNYIEGLRPKESDKGVCD